MSSDVDLVVRDATRRAGVEPNFVVLTGIGRSDATITLYHAPAEGALATTTLVYSGATGAFITKKPILGTRPSLGGKIYDLIGPLHFGNFAGTTSKLVWLGLGFATCYVVLTGMQLWLRRREAEQESLHRLDRAVMVVGFGLPFGLAASAVGYFLAHGDGSAAYWTPAAFVIAAGVAIVGGILARDAAALGRWLRLATGVVLVLLPAIRLATGGPGWSTAFAAGDPVAIAIDLAAIIAGAAMLYPLRWSWRLRGGSVAQPAE